MTSKCDSKFLDLVELFAKCLYFCIFSWKSFKESWVKVRRGGLRLLLRCRSVNTRLFRLHNFCRLTSNVSNILELNPKRILFPFRFFLLLDFAFEFCFLLLLTLEHLEYYSPLSQLRFQEGKRPAALLAVSAVKCLTMAELKLSKRLIKQTKHAWKIEKPAWLSRNPDQNKTFDFDFEKVVDKICKNFSNESTKIFTFELWRIQTEEPNPKIKLRPFLEGGVISAEREKLKPKNITSHVWIRTLWVTFDQWSWLQIKWFHTWSLSQNEAKEFES